jgi:hypothetical protein
VDRFVMDRKAVTGGVFVNAHRPHIANARRIIEGTVNRVCPMRI